MKITCKRHRQWLRLYLGDRHVATVYAEHGEPVYQIIDLVEKYFEDGLTPCEQPVTKSKKEDSK